MSFGSSLGHWILCQSNNCLDSCLLRFTCMKPLNEISDSKLVNYAVSVIVDIAQILLNFFESDFSYRMSFTEFITWMQFPSFAVPHWPDLWSFIAVLILILYTRAYPILMLSWTYIIPLWLVVEYLSHSCSFYLFFFFLIPYVLIYSKGDYSLFILLWCFVYFFTFWSSMVKGYMKVKSQTAEMTTQHLP